MARVGSPAQARPRGGLGRVGEGPRDRVDPGGRRRLGRPGRRGSPRDSLAGHGLTVTGTPQAPARSVVVHTTAQPCKGRRASGRKLLLPASRSPKHIVIHMLCFPTLSLCNRANCLPSSNAQPLPPKRWNIFYCVYIMIFCKDNCTPYIERAHRVIPGPAYTRSSECS